MPAVCLASCEPFVSRPGFVSPLNADENGLKAEVITLVLLIAAAAA